MDPTIEESWKNILSEEFNKGYFAELKKFLVSEKSKHKVYPPGEKIFAAFNFLPFEKVKVVLLGQDPYHGAGQAHGLCFSVPHGVSPPPSLVNIFKEIKSDLGIEIPSHGNLESWAKQGVLLLNATLTVRANQAGSHQKQGWETFTDAVIQKLSLNRNTLVFILWGRYAQSKESLIDTNKHYILKTGHPSPLSAYKAGFFGCKHFSQTNQILQQNGLEPINWNL
ncbi:MAG: uracil-DNA glycosylase [Bacteroidetes bacterium]|nr:uracil-DNA glycosylase [Bacteroidota bacterium]MBT6687584.1 uracil-DNA glycosylase [Bacteroidota bacterium]MBT7143583.1 uracil-DNA glycosylase [Bacteroidota bacterium]MBT7492179.1 uracil-DNA glycosylase [Bacteroidota bacterium]